MRWTPVPHWVLQEDACKRHHMRMSLCTSMWDDRRLWTHLCLLSEHQSICGALVFYLQFSASRNIRYKMIRQLNRTIFANSLVQHHVVPDIGLPSQRSLVTPTVDAGCASLRTRRSAWLPNQQECCRPHWRHQSYSQTCLNICVVWLFWNSIGVRDSA